MDDVVYDLTNAKKAHSKIGWALCVILAAAIIAQLLLGVLPVVLWGADNWLTSSSWGMWLVTFAPIYLIAIPAGQLVFRRIPGETPEQKPLSLKDFLVFIPIVIFLMYAGNIVGNVLSAVLSGGTAENALEAYAMDTNPLKILVMVILAPLLEEYVFRKQIIDRTRRYGEKTAVLLSGLAFGLFHMNLFQFFYAFALGMVFGYIYVRTGRLRYPVILHAIVNFMGSVLAPFILTLVDMELLEAMETGVATEEMMAQYGDALPGLMVYMVYSMFLMVMAIAGLILFMMKRKKLIWKEAAQELPKGSAAKTVYWNAGMLVYMLLCIGFIVLALL